MALRLVNTSPGETAEAVKPGQFVQFGFRSETLKVPLSTVSVGMGLSNVIHHGTLPELDTALDNLGATVVLETSERRRPVDGDTSITLAGSDVVFTKNNLLDGERGIYEVSFPIEERASCLATFKFRTKTAWTPFSADWCSLSNMVGMYFGLEHGTFNTAAYMFLRDNSPSGSLVTGGPLPAYNAVRPGQVEVLPTVPHAETPGFAWKTLPNNSVVEFFIYFNVDGYQSPPAVGIATNTPVVEIWTKIPTDPGPVVQAYIPVGALGTFPSSLVNVPFTNSRPGTSKSATVFFGNIARTGGSDVLELLDWAFYPDFRLAVKDGVERPDHDLLVRADAPVEYSAKANELPFSLTPGRWFPEDAPGFIPPIQSLFYQAGRRGEALYLSLDKIQSGLSAVKRTEPRLVERLDGVMIEAYVAGEVITPDGDGTGMGFGIDDGEKRYEVMLVDNPSRSFYGIVKDTTRLDDESDGYHSPSSDADVGSLKLVRLVVDRLRPVGIGGGRVELQVDEEVVLARNLASDVFPPTTGDGVVRFGHLGLPSAQGKLKISRINYLPRYLAWEAVDLLTPEDLGINARVRFTENSTGLGSGSIVGGELILEKSDVGGSSKFVFEKGQAFSEIDGQQVDFKMKIESITDSGGQNFPKNSESGITLSVFLGNKKVEVGFFDCGPYGRYVAVLPPSGLASDVIQQTDVGRQYSAPVDWSIMTQYRLVIKGHDRIELTIGSPLSPPSISIPWRDSVRGFDLPLDITTPKLSFGHSGAGTASVSRWEYVRWGLSNGFDVAVQQQYPNGYPKYLFGGRAFIKSEFDQT